MQPGGDFGEKRVELDQQLVIIFPCKGETGVVSKKYCVKFRLTCAAKFFICTCLRDAFKNVLADFFR